MFKMGILLWQHKLTCFFNLEKSMKTICGNWFKLVIRLANTCMIYRSCLQFLVISQRFWENLMMVETEIWRFFSLHFQKKLQICHYRIAKCTETFWIGLRIHFRKKDICRKEKHKQSKVNFFQENTTLSIVSTSQRQLINWRINIIDWRTKTMLRKGFYH